MKLCDISDSLKDIKIYRDSEFVCLDFINSEKNEKVLTFVENEEYLKELSKSVSCIICTEKIAKFCSGKYGVIISEKPRVTFYLIHNYLSLNSKFYNREIQKTSIGTNCKISDKAVISKENVFIGNNVIIEEFVVIRENVHIGNNSIIRAGSKIGGEGFQFNKQGETFYIEHRGGVIIEDKVEIQYNSCVDKAVFPWDNTIIMSNTKIDNLIHIGHAVKVGHNSLIAANVSVGGSTMIGDNCWIGVGATISNGLIIGNNASVNIGAVVTKNILDGSSVSGNFAIDHSKFIDFIKKIR